MKKYKAIFFDWDGTAVMSRKAPVDEAVAAMKPLLDKGIRLAIISGTTIENIAGGEIEKYFTARQLGFLYLGLGRGAYNYAFQGKKPFIFADRIPDRQMLAMIHRICFDIHMELKNTCDFNTDIIFSRPNYCKIDLMVDNFRGDNLFMQEDELRLLKERLQSHGIQGGIKGLMELAVLTGERYGVKVVPTCDAKYLEVGITSKSDNVNIILQKIVKESGIAPCECSYWGDEFAGIEPGIFGSDSFMCTEDTREGDFFDVSAMPGKRPEKVVQLGGGVDTFLKFLKQMNQ